MRTDSTIEEARARYAEEIRISGEIKSDALVTALNRVPRENFVGPGPWHFSSKNSWAAGGLRYVLSESADPRLVYQNTAIAIDVERDLTNGHPGRVAALIDALDPRPGGRLLHVGCGTGYYTAILAELVGPTGRVVAVEIDASLARQAANHLEEWPQVMVHCGNANTFDPGEVDGIFVSAGVLKPALVWLDRLATTGRMILPLTFAIPNTSLTKGAAFLIRRDEGKFLVQYHSFTMIYGDPTDRDAALNDLLQHRYRAGTWEQVRSLRRDVHPPDDSCWFHTPACCFSTIASL